MAEQFGWQGTDLGTYIQNPVRGGVNLPDLSGLKIPKRVMDKDIERMLKDFDTRYPGIREKALGSSSAWKLIRDSNRVLTTKGKYKGKYVDRRTGNLWNEESLKNQFSKDWRTTRRATAPLGSINRSKLNLLGHDLIHKAGPLAAIRRILSDRTLEGGNVYDWQQGQRREKIIAENELLRNTLSIGRQRLGGISPKDQGKYGVSNIPPGEADAPVNVEARNQAERNRAIERARNVEIKEEVKQNQTSKVNQPTTRQKVVNTLDKTANVLNKVNDIIPDNRIHGPQFTPDPSSFRMATGQAFNDKTWQSLLNSGQVFDTTKKFGEAGGYWINDSRGIPRFIKYKGA